ncbi:hypothetical protein RAA17_01870 [Komagataeibacter rhaeticus]|nr:hypothetical protein [Komagataeibacter rhaeticus]
MDSTFDTLLRGGTLIDPMTGRHGVADIGVRDGRIMAIEPVIDRAATARETHDISGKIVTAGMIDTHGHVYEHVTGRFGLNADMVGVRSGVTTLVDQGGPSCMTIGGFRHFIAEPAASRVLCFLSAYLVGGLEGISIRSFTAPARRMSPIPCAPRRKTGILCAGSRPIVNWVAFRAGGWMSSVSANASRATRAFRFTSIWASSGRPWRTRPTSIPTRSCGN